MFGTMTMICFLLYFCLVINVAQSAGVRGPDVELHADMNHRREQGLICNYISNQFVKDGNCDCTLDAVSITMTCRTKVCVSGTCVEPKYTLVVDRNSPGINSIRPPMSKTPPPVNFVTLTTDSITSYIQVPSTTLTLKQLNSTSYTFPALSVVGRHNNARGKRTTLKSCEVTLGQGQGAQSCPCSVCAGGRSVSIDCTSNTLLPTSPQNVRSLAKLNCVGLK